MSFSNTIHVAGASQHFERIARTLMLKRKAKDYSTCDLRIELREGFDMVHSIVASAHSTSIAKSMENCRAPYAPLDMTSFDDVSVRRIFDWMYTGEIHVPSYQFSNDLAVVSNLKIPMLQRQFELHLKEISEKGNVITALNISSAETFLVTDETMLSLVIRFCKRLNELNDGDIVELTLNSILAFLATLLPAEKKVPLINVAIQWINLKKADRIKIHKIVQSIVISDMTYDCLYNVRYTLNENLTIKSIASKAHVHLASDGTVMLIVSPHDGLKKKLGSLTRTKSEISFINDLPDPFNKSSNSTNNEKKKKTETQSVTKMIDSSDDPFEKTEASDESPKYSEIKCKKLGRTSSELKVINDIPDPFISNSNVCKQNKTEKASKAIEPTCDPFERRISVEAVKPSSEKKLPHLQLSKSNSKNPIVSSSVPITDSSTSIADPFEKNFTVVKASDRKSSAIFKTKPKRTTSEQSFINALPDVFDKNFNLQSYFCAPENDLKKQKLQRSKSELEFINKLPDPFTEDESHEKFILRKKSDGTSHFFTKTEAEHIRNLSDPFNEDLTEEKCISRQNADGSVRVFTISEADHIQSLADPFNENQSQEKCMTKLKADGTVQFFTESETDHIRQLADPFGSSKAVKNQNNIHLRPQIVKHQFPKNETSFGKNQNTLNGGPVVMVPLKGCVSPYNSSNTSSSSSLSNTNLQNLNKIDFVVAGNRVKRTPSQISDIQKIPSCFNDLKLNKPQKKDSKYEHSYRLYPA